MKIWFKEFTIAELNEFGKNTLASNIGIEMTEMGDDFLRGRMPVDQRTRQPYGVLHGGASVALAETLGSVACYCAVDQTRYRCLGLEINANHLRGISEGYVYGTARPLHRGRRTQVWEIRITDAEDRLVCMSRITMAVIERTPEG